MLDVTDEKIDKDQNIGLGWGMGGGGGGGSWGRGATAPVSSFHIHPHPSLQWKTACPTSELPLPFAMVEHAHYTLYMTQHYSYDINKNLLLKPNHVIT